MAIGLLLLLLIGNSSLVVHHISQKNTKKNVSFFCVLKMILFPLLVIGYPSLVTYLISPKAVGRHSSLVNHLFSPNAEKNVSFIFSHKMILFLLLVTRHSLYQRKSRKKMFLLFFHIK